MHAQFAVVPAPYVHRARNRIRTTLLCLGALLSVTACCGGGAYSRPASAPPTNAYTYTTVYGTSGSGAPAAAPAPAEAPAVAAPENAAPAVPEPGAPAAAPYRAHTDVRVVAPPPAEPPRSIDSDAMNPRGAPHAPEPRQVRRSSLHVVPPPAPASGVPTTPGTVVPAARPSAPSVAATPVVVAPPARTNEPPHAVNPVIVQPATGGGAAAVPGYGGPATPTVVAPRVVAPRVAEPAVAPPRVVQQPAQPVVRVPSAVPVRPASPAVQNPAPVVPPAGHVTRNDSPKVVRATVPGAAPSAPDPRKPVARGTTGKPRTPARRVDPKVNPVGQVPLRPFPVHPVPVRPVPTDAPAVRTAQ